MLWYILFILSVLYSFLIAKPQEYFIVPHYDKTDGYSYTHLLSFAWLSFLFLKIFNFSVLKSLAFLGFLGFLWEAIIDLLLAKIISLKIPAGKWYDVIFSNLGFFKVNNYWLIGDKRGISRRDLIFDYAGILLGALIYLYLW
jgi:hypothetical protein